MTEHGINVQHAVSFSHIHVHLYTHARVQRGKYFKLCTCRSGHAIDRGARDTAIFFGAVCVPIDQDKWDVRDEDWNMPEYIVQTTQQFGVVPSWTKVWP